MGVAASSSARSAAADNDVAHLQEIASARPAALLRQSLWKQRSALHVAARAGALEALCAVLDVAAHYQPGSLLEVLNAPDYAGDTALALACRSGFASCVRELLEAGASPLPANTQGVTPLHHAAAGGHAACVRLLLTCTVRLADGSRCPAGQAPVRDTVDLERFIDTRTNAGLCALHLAVLCGSYASVAELVNHGAQLDTPLLTISFRTPSLNPPCLGPGSTALHMAAATGRLPLCVLILHAQQQRHPGLELRRMRNSRGMTPLNICLVCDHRNLASLLTPGAPVPAPPAPPRGRAGVGQLPPLLRQQLLALVHRAGLLSQLRELGLGSGAAAAAPPLPGLAAGPIAQLEALLHSDAATAAQVLAVVDSMLDEAAAAASGARSDGSGEASTAASRAARRRERARRRQQEREAAAAGQPQAGVDWTLLERNRSLWHAEHMGSSALARRIRRERHRNVTAATSPAAAAGSRRRQPEVEPEQALLLAGALLEDAQTSVAAGASDLPEPAQQRGRLHSRHGSSSSSAGGGGSSRTRSSSTASLPNAAAPGSPFRQQVGELEAQQAQQAQHADDGKQQQLAPASPASQVESSTCPMCLDLPADISIAPCGHRACLGCCGRLAAHCTSGSGSSLGLPTTGPLCPLCRAPIETFLRGA